MAGRLFYLMSAANAINAVDLIVAKRDGLTLEPGDISALVQAYTRGDVPDYQMSAFLMAAFLRGLNSDETFALTDAMLHSGEVIDLSTVPGIKVDKHSTGGVGDKISLILAPIVAACGVPVPMISGRGLGFTGGTLDKLESITGFRTDLTTDQYRRQLAELGVVMIGQTDQVAPADRALYALRDVSGTVEFIPFIASSILSKKLAEGIDALVLDVKCGKGAFMKDESSARELAQTLVYISEHFGTRCVAWLTDMNVPLGQAIGNWPEVVESVHCLQGHEVEDVMEVTYALAGEMIVLGGKASSPEEGREKAEASVRSGAAFDVFQRLVAVQGGNVDLLEKPEARSGYEAVERVTSESEGIVVDLDALRIGHTVTRMGAGRTRKEDSVDPLAGLVLHRSIGDRVERGETLAHLHTGRTERVEEYTEAIRSAFRIESEPTGAAVRSRLMDRFAEGRWKSGA